MFALKAVSLVQPPSPPESVPTISPPEITDQLWLRFLDPGTTIIISFSIMSWKFFEIGVEQYLIASNTVAPGNTGCVMCVY